MSDTVWQLIGAGLFVWVLYDLFAGQTWLHRKYRRSQEPLRYWAVLSLWLVIALWCLGIQYWLPFWAL